MAKKIQRKITLQLPAGQANPAPPVGTALGPTGINIGQFCQQFNEATKEMTGSVIPAVISIFEDRTFEFKLKTSPASDMLKKAANIAKGSGDPLKNKAATITKEQVKEIAEKKMEDLNATSVEGAMKIIEGTARSMGIEITK